MAPLFCIPYERWSRVTLVRRVEECPIPKRLLHFLIPRLLARGFASRTTSEMVSFDFVCLKQSDDRLSKTFAALKTR